MLQPDQSMLAEVAAIAQRAEEQRRADEAARNKVELERMAAREREQAAMERAQVLSRMLEAHVQRRREEDAARRKQEAKEEAEAQKQAEEAELLLQRRAKEEEEKEKLRIDQLEAEELDKEIALALMPCKGLVLPHGQHVYEARVMLFWRRCRRCWLQGTRRCKSGWIVVRILCSCLFCPEGGPPGVVYMYCHLPLHQRRANSRPNDNCCRPWFLINYSLVESYSGHTCMMVRDMHHGHTCLIHLVARPSVSPILYLIHPPAPFCQSHFTNHFVYLLQAHTP